MSYSELVSWMFGLERFGIKLGLENMEEFLARVGDPHRAFKTVHVTGTNGKGSVCVFLAEVLREHGLKVGLYTSPHLVDFRERIKVDGRMIPEEDVVRIGSDLRGVMESMAKEDGEKQLTFFEFTTGLAFQYFKERKVDIVVTEVGMGGRLDATNVVTPEVSVITRIGLEHTNYLGRTIPEIAREKAGIIKKGVPVITCDRSPEALAVISGTCRKKGARLARIGHEFDVTGTRMSLDGVDFDYRGVEEYKDIHSRLLGTHQAQNAGAAVAVVEELARRGIEVSERDLRAGLKRAAWPGRLDVVSRRPLVILDGSHNPDGIGTTVKALEALDVLPLTYVLGCMDDKDAEGIVAALAPTAAKILVTQARFKRALAAERLEEVVKRHFGGPTETLKDPAAAFERGLASIEGKGLCIIGSLYLVGEAIPWWGDRKRKRSHKV